MYSLNDLKSNFYYFENQLSRKILYPTRIIKTPFASEFQTTRKHVLNHLYFLSQK